jgi:hypothetical protein
MKSHHELRFFVTAEKTLRVRDFLNWQPLFTNPPVVGTLQFLDVQATNRPARFYRLEER